MDKQAYTDGLAELRGYRDEIKKLTGARDKLLVKLGGYEKAEPERLAKSAGIGLADVVGLVPELAPEPLAPTPTQALTEPKRAPAAPLAQPAQHAQAEPEPERPGVPAPTLSAKAAPDVAEPPATAPAPAAEEQTRILTSLPDDDTWFATSTLSTRPNFEQRPRAMVFLDANTGQLVYRDQVHRLDLGHASAAEILTAVFATVPDTVERIYITAGAPWHRDADRHRYLKDAVAAWLNAPTPGWKTATGRGGQDRLAGHFVNERFPVGRWQRGDHRAEIRSVAEWFTVPDHADATVARDAFVLLWQALRREWPDAVLMGSPSQTGRDLWSRTIPTKGKWAGGYPVLSTELHGLMYATAGQGRTQLLTPPDVPAQLPGLVEYDRTFAYAKHTWKSGVGTPRRVTPATFASWSEKEQAKAMYGCTHWQVRVTVPDGWEHVGILPAPAGGGRDWCYPNQPGRTFTTWVGGPELLVALSNPIQPWKIDILDGLMWEDGDPLRGWADKLKSCWSALAAQGELHAEERGRTVAYLASRAVRNVLIYGIGAFAQRPKMTSGTTPADQKDQVPDGAEILSWDDETINWQRSTGYTAYHYSHPEWAAGVWSGARAALLSMRMREDNAFVGALHVPAKSVVAFRTDAVYLTGRAGWPYHGQPGEYLLKGHLPGPIPTPASEQELLQLRNRGRAALTTA